jgi:hypothetical protein
MKTRLPLIISCAALFFALGGIGYARKVVHLIDGHQIKKDSIPGNRLKDNAVTGRQINESTLATVPRAVLAASAASATTAKNASSADTAARLTPAGEFHPLTLDTANGWTDASAAGPGHVTAHPAGYYEDREGFVHLEGAVENASSHSNGLAGEIAQLPLGARPGGTPAQNDLIFAAAFRGNTLGVIDITGTGLLSDDTGDTRFISLEGIEYRARG